MNAFEKYFTDFEHHLDGLEYHKSSNEIEIIFREQNVSLKLNAKALKSLSKGDLIDNIRQFKYYNHYGFSFENYGEYFIGNDSNSLYELYGANTNIDLSFKIAGSQIEINTVSDLCKILLQPYYSKYLEYIADRGLGEYFYTIKIYDTPVAEHKELLLKSIYYLNSHYMHKTGSFVKIYQVLPKDFDVLIDDFDDIENYTINVERKRTRTRKDFISIEPIIFFNHASTQSKENSFLSFYRILEFFFYRALESELKKQRFDSAVSEKSIIQSIQKKDERSLLLKLLKNTLTSAEKQKIVSFLLHKSLIDKNSFDCFSDKLYEYRNSLVHAKEYQINSTQIPDLFGEKNECNAWNFVIRNIAKICISRLNTK